MKKEMLGVCIWNFTMSEVVTMQLREILSLNIRGLGLEDKNKFNWFKRVCDNQKPNVIALQETKAEKISEFWVEKVWGSCDYKYAFKKSKGTEIILVNIYGPQSDSEKRKMWNDLNDILKMELCGLSLAILMKDGDIDFGPKPVKVFDEWLMHEDSFDIIKTTWNKRTNSTKPDCIFRDKLKLVKQELKRWYSTSHGKLKTEIEELTCVINEWEKKVEISALNDEDYNKWMVDKENLLQKEKSQLEMLKQKSRFKWALEGDENSKFFHSFIRRRNQKNNIHGANIGGVWNSNPLTIKNEAFSFFQRLFKKNTSEPWMLNNWDGLKIEATSAEALESPFTETEVLDAIKSCGRNKAPGPDGFNIMFYIKFWDIIKDDLLKALKWFWETGSISNGCNASFITLIPKVNDPLNFSNFRPISLIGSYYKILSKLLANRIRKIIPGLIGDEQSAFISNRYILDGVLIALESLEDLKSRNQKSFIFKVDFKKAFDCLDWDFLSSTMSSMGFGAKWVKWILSCLNSTSISVLINGSPTDQFFPKRGVRQGDPLSPFLFIIAGEGLNQLLKIATNKKLINGVEIGKDKVVVSHLQYADDTIIFGKWNKVEVRNILKILKCFEDLSGLKINLNKSNVYGICTTNSELASLASWFNCKEGSFPFNYLGLPIGAKIRNGAGTKFWIDKWIGDVPLKDAYPRLFKLEASIDASIADPIKAHPFACSPASSLHPAAGPSRPPASPWPWKLDPSGRFSTSSLVQFLSSLAAENALASPPQPTNLNPLIPQKIGIFVWRAKQNKLPVRVSLDKKGIDLHSLRCPVCDDDIETLHHTLLTCSFAKDIWERIKKWWNFSHLPISNISDIAKSPNPFLNSNHGITIWQAVVWVTSYHVWAHRNARTFRGNCLSSSKTVTDIQSKSFEWINVRWKKGSMNWLTWITNPKSFDASLSKVGVG
ncbi:uncharacterized protein [Rutidosis leptorrhynchoides]|uniref:uncharacterized protein n=1 Tax=Rutidosis leptorrhynchoides TaxID=125765 RepID=UPI003A999A23